MASSHGTSKTRMCFTSECDRTKRLNANLIERRRMQNINTGFTSLKKLLPPSDKKQTKAAILHQASQHIVRLQRAILQVKSENEFLRQRMSVANDCPPPTNRQPLRENYMYTCCNTSATCPQRACASHTDVNFEVDYSPPPDPRKPMTHFSQMHAARRGSFAHSILPKPHPSESKAHHIQPNLSEHTSSSMEFETSAFHGGFNLELQSFEDAFEPGPLTPPFTPPDRQSRRPGDGLRKSQSYSGAINTEAYSGSPDVPLNPYTDSLSMLSRPNSPRKNIFNCTSKEVRDTPEPAMLDAAAEACRPSCALEKNKAFVRTLSQTQVRGNPKSPEEQTNGGNLECLLEAISMVEEK